MKRTWKRDEREVEGVIFIPFTQGGELRKILQKADDNLTKTLGMQRTRFVERAGISVQDVLVDKDPWYRLNQGCQRKRCYICRTNRGKGIKCSQQGIGYSIQCSLCQQQGKKCIYFGESSRSSYERIGEHMWAFKQKKEPIPDKNSTGSVLWLHSKECHDGKMRTDHWEPKVISRHRGALNRQVTEGVKIINEGVSNLLNSKNEFGANNLTELIMKNGHAIVGENKRKLNSPTFKTDSKIKIEECDMDDADVDRQKPARKKQKSISDPETIEIVVIGDVNYDDNIETVKTDMKYDDADVNTEHDVDDNNLKLNKHSIDHDPESRLNADNNKKIKYDIKSEKYDSDDKTKSDIDIVNPRQGHGQYLGNEDVIDVDGMKNDKIDVDLTKNLSDFVVAVTEKESFKDMLRNELVKTCKERGLPSSGN